METSINEWFLQGAWRRARLNDCGPSRTARHCAAAAIIPAAAAAAAADEREKNIGKQAPVYAPPTISVRFRRY